MEFRFNENDLDVIIAKIKDELKDRDMGKILNFTHSDSDLRITIKKLGTSTLDFSVCEDDGGLLVELTKEKLALSHRPLKKELVQKLEKIVEKIGGSMH